MKLVLAFLVASMVFAEDVKNVKQKFETTANDDIAAQITRELQASYLYQAYSKYFSRADVALPGFAKYFDEVSKREMAHAHKFMAYINKRGGTLALNDITLTDVCNETTQGLGKFASITKRDACICYFMTGQTLALQKCEAREKWFNGLMAMEDALVLERYINEKLLAIHKNNKADPHLRGTLEREYLTVQVDTIKEIADTICQLKRVGPGVGEFTFDQYL